MEGGVFAGVALGPFLQLHNASLENGCSLELMNQFLKVFCSMSFPHELPNSCAEFIFDLYGMGSAGDDMERVRQYVEFAGEYRIPES